MDGMTSAEGSRLCRRDHAAVGGDADPAHGEAPCVPGLRPAAAR